MSTPRTSRPASGRYRTAWPEPYGAFLDSLISFVVIAAAVFYLVIKPVNDALLATEADKAGPQARVLIVKWGSVHAVRTLLGGFATAAFFWACLSR